MITPHCHDMDLGHNITFVGNSHHGKKMCVLEKDAQEVLKNNSMEIQEEYTPEDLERDCNKSPQKELEKTSIEANSKESNTKGGKATKKNVQWIKCEICSYKSKSENTEKKHTESKHKNIKKCTVCDKQFNSEKSFKDHINKDHNNSHEDLHISLNSNNDLDARLEHIEVAEYGDGESDVSIDEERMEALDREMNPGDHIEKSNCSTNHGAQWGRIAPPKTCIESASKTV